MVGKFLKRHNRKRITITLRPEANENVKFSHVQDKDEKNAYRERLSKLQERKVAVPRLINWDLFAEYECEEQLRSMMVMTYVYPGDGDTFEDRSWERAFSIRENVVKEWCLEFFSTFYFNRKVNDVINDVCVWFRLCGNEHAFSLPNFAAVLGLYTVGEINHRLFGPHFVSLARVCGDSKILDSYWNRIGDPSCSRRNASAIRNPLLKVLQKLISWGLLYRHGNQDKCTQPDLWTMKLLEEDKNGNAAWIIAEYLSKRAPGIKKQSDVCGGHYVTVIAKNLGYYTDVELRKCRGRMDSEIWDAASFGEAFDRKNRVLGAWTEPRGGASSRAYMEAPSQPPMGSFSGNTQSGFDSGWGDWNRELNAIECRDVWRDNMMMRTNYNYDYSMPMLQHLARDADYEVPPYQPPNVPPYPLPYEPYPGPYPYPYPGYSPFPEPYPPYGRLPEYGSSGVNVGGPSFTPGGSSNYAGGSSSRAGMKKRRVVDDEDDDDDDDEEDEFVRSDMDDDNDE